MKNPNNIFRQLSSILKHYVPRVTGIILLVGIIGGSASIDLSNSAMAGAPQAPSAQWDSVFGVEETPIYIDGTLTNGLSDMDGTRTAWVRGPEVDWSKVEATQGVIDWSAMQDAVDEVAEINAMNYLAGVTVRGTPEWAQRYPGVSCGPIKQSNFSDFADFVGELMTDSPLKDYNVFVWEIWNEPDISRQEVPPDNWWGGCWGEPTDTNYYGGKYFSQMLTPVYDKIKSINPYVTVTVGGLRMECDPINPPSGQDCTSTKFINGILEDGKGQNFDAVGFHAFDYYKGAYGHYANESWNSYWNTTGPVMRAKAKYIYSLFDKYDITGKSLINSENALLCDGCEGESNFEATKANYLAQAYGTAIADGLRANIWFDILGTWGRSNGLVSIDDYNDPVPNKKYYPAFHAYDFGSTELSEATYIGKLNMYPGVTGYEFTRGDLEDEHIWMLWSLDGLDHPITLPATPIVAYDVTGTEFHPGKNLTITLEPFYIHLSASVARIFVPYMVNNLATSIVNGGFERGEEGWDFDQDEGLDQSVISDNPPDPVNGGVDSNIPIGTKSALLGSTEYGCQTVPLGYSVIEQEFLVPDAGGADVTVEFDYIIYSQDENLSPHLEPAGGTYDRFEVYIKGQVGGFELAFRDMIPDAPNLNCSTWRRIPSTNYPSYNGETSGWAKGIIDLNAYKGETITISFRTYNRIDNWYNTLTYMDEVMVVVSP